MIKKILLVRNDNVGDLICTTPAIEALRKKYPTTKIDIVVNSYNYDAIANNPFVDTIYCYTKPKHKKGIFQKIKAAFGKLKILIDIVKQKYDVVVVFRSGYSKSAELFSDISFAPIKIGVKDKNNKDNFTHHIEVKDNHEVEFCFDCLALLDVSYDKENTRYFISEALRQKYKELNEHLLFHISSRVKENRYSKENFKKVIDELKEYKISISAEPEDIQSAKWLEKNTHATFLQTKSLNDLGGAICNVKLFITLDGGAMHLAPALGCKTISISGKTNMKKWHPWGYKELVLQHESKIANSINPKDIVKMIKENS